MVDIKREDITLSDWTKGISADEYAGGSYFFSDGIQTGYDTKGFKLGPYVNASVLNNRTTGWPVAVCPTIGDIFTNSSKGFMAFTNDGKMEMDGSLNGSESGQRTNGGGAIFCENVTSAKYAGGIIYGNYALGLTTGGDISKVDFHNIYDPDGEGISNPDFSNSGSGWTIGTGWTITSNGAEHTTGNTGTLETTATANADGRLRMAFKITNSTNGKVTVSSNSVTRTTENKKNGWFTFSMNTVTNGTFYTVTLTPSSDFNGTIEYVNFNVFDSNYRTSISGLTPSDNYQALVRQGDIYIGGGNVVNVLSTTDRTLSGDKSLIDSNETIVALTQQAGSLIIWATDGMHSKQYYWDGVSNVASEVIEWKGQVIKAVVGTETVAYVLTSAQSTSDAAAFRLYSVNGYQRSLIASNCYNVKGVVSNYSHYHKDKKFVFNDVDGPGSMCMYLDNLYIPGCDGVYMFGQNIPGLSNAWSRPITYPLGADKIFLLQSGDIWMTYRLNQVQYYARIQSNYFCPTGYLVTESIYRDKLSTRKAIQNLKIGYKSIPREDGNIKIYAIVDDDYFWRFDVTGVTNRPAIGDVYTVAEDTTAEIIMIDKATTTTGTITLKTVSNGGSLFKANNTLTKVSGDGDASISNGMNYDNMVLVKTIETDKQEFGSDLIFGKDFVNSYMPYRHKLQLVIELNKNNNVLENKSRTPEIYEISMVADITDVTL